MKKISRNVLKKASDVVKVAAVKGAGAHSAIIVHEPKVPAKLRRD